MHTNRHTNRHEIASKPSRWARLIGLTPLVAALAACGGGGSSDPAPGADPAGGAGGAQAATVPADLVGQWEVVLAYVPVSYTGQATGTTPGDGSLGITLVLTADGRYRHVWNSSQAYFNGNCFRTGGWDEHGTINGPAAGTAADFTFTAAKATYIQTDTCGQNKYLDPVPGLKPGTHTLTIEHDNTGWPLLRFTFPTGDIVLEKCRHCG